MISQYFITLGVGLVGWMGTLFPGWDPPDWMTGTPQMLLEFLNTFQGLGVWVDWTALGICSSAVIGVYGTGFAIRLTRAIVAHIPFIGGGG